MMLNITGRFPLQITNIRTDTEIEGTQMRTAELKIGEHKTPCVIWDEAYGKVGELNTRQTFQTSIMVFACLRQTKLTKQGYVAVQITTKPVHVSVYIHADYLESFFGVCAMSAIKTDPKS
jgi:hypothetical protein